MRLDTRLELSVTGRVNLNTHLNVGSVIKLISRRRISAHLLILKERKGGTNILPIGVMNSLFKCSLLNQGVKSVIIMITFMLQTMFALFTVSLSFIMLWPHQYKPGMKPSHISMAVMRMVIFAIIALMAYGLGFVIGQEEMAIWYRENILD